MFRNAVVALFLSFMAAACNVHVIDPSPLPTGNTNSGGGGTGSGGNTGGNNNGGGPTTPNPGGGGTTDQPWTDGSMLDLVQQHRKNFPTPMSEDQRALLMNRVACASGNSRWGLSRKDSGKRGNVPGVPVPVATDVLAYLGTDKTKPLVHALYDVLRDSEGVGEPIFVKIGDNRDSSRPWVAPSCPSS